MPTNPAQPQETPLLRRSMCWKVFGLALGLATVLLGLCFFPALLNRPLCEVPEARVAQVGREMLANGDWVVPTLGGERRDFKPPLPYWLTALSAEALDPSRTCDETTMARAVQLPSAVCCALSVFAVVLFAGLTLGWQAGLSSGVLLGLCWFTIRFGRLGFVDTTLMAACTLVVIGAALIVCSKRPPLWAALLLGAGFGFAVLVKEPIPFIVLGGAMAAEVLIRRQWNTRKVLLVALAAALSIAIVLPWFALLAERTPGGWTALIEQRQTMWQAGHHQSDRWIFYFKKLGEAFLPWTPTLVLAAVCASVRTIDQTFTGWLEAGLDRARPRFGDLDSIRLLRFLGLVCALGLLAFYSQAKQQDHYLLPLLPAFALLGGALLAAFSEPGGRREERLAWCQLILGVIGAAALATAPLWFRKAEAFGLSWLVVIPAAVVFLIVYFFSARQWVEGRPGLALLAPALLALTVFSILGCQWTRQVHDESIYAREAPALKRALADLAPCDQLYFVGPDELLMFYLNRPVRTLHQLVKEAPDAKASRMLILRRKDLGGRAPWVETFIQGQAEVAHTDSFTVFLLPPEIDWPAQARNAPIWGKVQAPGDDE